MDELDSSKLKMSIHLYEMGRVGKSIEMESNWWLPRVRDGGAGEK